MTREGRDASLWRRPLTAALVSAATVAVVLTVVLPAYSTPAASEATVPQRVTTLERKLRTLERTLRTAQTNVRNAQAQMACIFSVSPVGLARFGNPQGNQGYTYRRPDGSTVLTTALDVTAQGETPTVYIPTVNPQCIRTGLLKPAWTPSPQSRP